MMASQVTVRCYRPSDHAEVTALNLSALESAGAEKHTAPGIDADLQPTDGMTIVFSDNPLNCDTGGDVYAPGLYFESALDTRSAAAFETSVAVSLVESGNIKASGTQTIVTISEVTDAVVSGSLEATILSDSLGEVVANGSFSVKRCF